MADRIRALLDRPLDPSAARAIMVCASAIFLGLAAVFVLADRQPDRAAPRGDRPAAASPLVPAPPGDEAGDEAAGRHRRTLRQDPQDIDGSIAARRVGRAFRSHQALQHVPYREGEITVALVGARGNRAVMRVSAPSVPAARKGWRRFLRRYGDAGRAYVPVFTAASEARPRGGA